MLKLLLSRIRPPPPATEPELLRRVAQGDRDALASLYRDYQPRLARFLSRHTRQEGLMEEVINDTFWVVWQKAAEFRGDARVSTWIIGIAYRIAMKAFRDQGPFGTPVGDDVLADTLFNDPREDQERRDWIDKGMGRLTPDQRMTMELVYGQGHSLEETAAIMCCPVGTAKARLFHARVRLRNLLPQLAGDEPLPPKAEGS